MADPEWKTSSAEIEAIVAGRHGDPFRLLGLHQHGKTWVVTGLRARRPVARGGRAPTASRWACSSGATMAGFFEGKVAIKDPPAAHLCGGQWRRRAGRSPMPI